MRYAQVGVGVTTVRKEPTAAVGLFVTSIALHFIV